MYLINNNMLVILVHAILVQAILVQAIISNKLSIINDKLSTISNNLISSSNKLSILVQAILVRAILVQRYSCAPNILYFGAEALRLSPEVLRLIHSIPGVGSEVLSCSSGLLEVSYKLPLTLLCFI